MKTQVLSLADFQAAIRSEGVPLADAASVPIAKPQDAKAQWDLLKPYVGRPLRDIPAALVLLFATQTGKLKTGTQLAQAIRSLPLQERMASSSSDSEEFI